MTAILRQSVRPLRQVSRCSAQSRNYAERREANECTNAQYNPRNQCRQTCNRRVNFTQSRVKITRLIGIAGDHDAHPLQQQLPVVACFQTRQSSVVSPKCVYNRGQ